ncbi:uroporphyrinogen-III synthase [Falsiroseomonas sp. HW251]|uniref:uroporphyrinogen-III synthase n=1 Tax=Falsiroseomonas sp. HW251 TaxID=3390998 RepID=UPI003D312708
MPPPLAGEGAAERGREAHHAAPGVLVTRPPPGCDETAARLRALGWTPVLAPALILAPRRFVMPPVQAVLITSRAAARALPPPSGLPLLAVGEASAAEARAAGWTDTAAAAGTAEDLAELAASRFDPGGPPLLLAVGQGYALDLAADLRARGFRVIRRIAYAAAPAAGLPPDALAALRDGRVGTTLFHSPRSALCAINLIRNAGLAEAAARTEVLAISRRVAEAAATALAPLGWRSLRVAERPEEEALLRLLGRRDDTAADAKITSGEP